MTLPALADFANFDRFLFCCYRDQAYLRVKERQAKETLLESKLSRAFTAWRSTNIFLIKSRINLRINPADARVTSVHLKPL